jgi:site-specific DNA-methyltransferase (cytosine-N4-specific)
VPEPNSPPAASPALSIRQGDAFDLVATLDDQSIDLILTSPPYWGLRSYGLEHSEDVLERWTASGCTASRVPPYDWYRDSGGLLGREPYPAWYVEHLIEFFRRAQAVLKPHGSVWVNLGDTYFARWGSLRDNGRQGLADGRHRRRTPTGGYLHDKQLLMIPARFAIAMQEAGWILRNDLIWSKPNVIPRPENDRLRLSHEHWLHFVLRQPRGRPRYYYDLTACEPGARDVVTCEPAAGSNGHSATFPTEVIRPRILSSCPPHGWLLDPFCGTGRAIVEARRQDRNGIGFELVERYASAARLAVEETEAELAAASKKQNTERSATATVSEGHLLQWIK